MEDNKIKKLIVPNTEPKKFRQQLEKIKNGEYEVEQLNDGKKIVIKKPGKKNENDIRVDLYDPNSNARISLSHDEIREDIRKKYQKNPEETKNLIDGLRDVYEGKEPDDVIKERKIKNATGLPADTILKNFKWIWGQEDCNYKFGKGRWMSMEIILKEYGIKNEK